MSGAAEQVAALAHNYTSPEYTLAEIIRDYRSPCVTVLWPFWPFDAPAYADYCADHEVNPLATDSVHDFFVDHAAPICEKCGNGNPVMEWRTERDVYGTGDSPDESEFVGTSCCGAELIGSDGRYFDPTNLQVPW